MPRLGGAAQDGEDLRPIGPEEAGAPDGVELHDGPAEILNEPDVHHHGRPVLVALLLEPVRRRDEVPRPEHPPQVEAEELTELGVIDRRQGERGPVRGRLDELHLAPFEADEPFRLPQLKWDGAELIAIDRGNIREPFTFPDPSLGRLGDWTPPSLHLDWDPVEDLVAERNRHR